MSKKILLVLMCAISLIACNNEEDSCQGIKNMILKASIESELTDSRAGLETDGSFFWQEGDKIAALMTNGKVRPMTLEEGDGGKSSGDFKIATNETFGKYAFYPYSSTNKVNAAGELTIDFPSSYDYGNVIGEKENSFNFAMWGYLVNETVSFKHLGGVFKIYVHNLPVGEDMQFVFKATGKKIAGEFNADLTDSEPVLVTSEDNTNDNVVITFDNATADATGVFYIPVPTGTYPEIDVVLKMSDGEEFAFGYWTNQTVVRRAQKKGNIGEKTITGGEGDSAVKTVASVEDITSSVLATDKEDLLVQVVDEVKGNANVIEIPATLETETTTFFFASVADDAVITIVNETSGAYSGQIIIEIPENETIPTVNANIPDGEVYIKQGTVTTLVVSSAQNTTIIGAKAKIVNLVVEKGNVRIENGATVSNITRSSSNQDELTYVIFEGELPSEKNSDSKIIYVSAAEFGLYQAAKNGGTYTLTDDVTLSEILVIEHPLVLDGNGKTLTSTAGRAINVSGANGVTIQNLTINASGERAINIIQNSTNVTIDNVTATAANYTVNVASSAPNAKVDIKNSTLNGLCTVNVTAAGANVTVDNSTINCNDNNTTAGESYAALSLNKEAVGGKIIATNSTINVAAGSDSMPYRNAAENGSITIDGNEVDEYTISVVITYQGSPYYHGFATLADAVDFAKAGDVITLIRDIEISEKISVEKSITIDGAGKTLTYTGSGASARAIDVPSSANGVNLTVKNLTVDCTSSYCQRGINYNTNGKLVLDNVTVKGTNVTYALNLPGSSVGANVEIKNSSLTANIALNVWGKNSVVNVTDSHLTSVDTASHENYSAVVLNNDGTTIADGAVITITGGTITAKDENGNASNAVRNGTNTGLVQVSETTTVIGNHTDPVAIVTYGTDQFYSCETLQRAISKAIETNAVSVKLIKDIELTEPVTIAKGGNVTLDLNGKMISQTSESPISMITNNGTLTIIDSMGSGKVAFTYNGTPDTSVAANTISNRGLLIVEGGEISNTGNGNQIGYAIDNYNGSTLTVNGGKITASGSSYYDGIRLFCGSNATTVTVNGGNVSTIWAQNPSANKANEVKGTVIVNGGSVNTTYYERYTTVKVKSGISATITAYGEGSDKTTTITEGDYIVYSFVTVIF